MTNPEIRLPAPATPSNAEPAPPRLRIEPAREYLVFPLGLGVELVVVPIDGRTTWEFWLDAEQRLSPVGGPPTANPHGLREA